MARSAEFILDSFSCLCYTSMRNFNTASISFDFK